MAQVTFGLFDWIDRGKAPLHQLYEERLQLLEAADAAGFSRLSPRRTPRHAPRHGAFTRTVPHRRRSAPGAFVWGHLSTYCLSTTPCDLSRKSACWTTSRADAWIFGIGRGVSPYELGYFGVDAAQSRAIFNETLAILVAGLTHARLTFEGEHYQYHDVPMELQPLQQPYPPLWYPTNNPESVMYAARHGYHFVSLGPAAGVRQLVDVYWQTWEAHRQAPDRLNGHVDARSGCVRQVFIADTDAEALAATRCPRRLVPLNHQAVARPRRHMPTRFSWETSTQYKTILFGSPTRVCEQMAELLEVSGCNYMICAFAWGTFPHEQTLRSLRLFAEEVMPAFAGSAALA